jgi:hypothetical protein
MYRSNCMKIKIPPISRESSHPPALFRDVVVKYKYNGYGASSAAEADTVRVSRRYIRAQPLALDGGHRLVQTAELQTNWTGLT